LSLAEAYKGLSIFDNIPLRYIKPDFVKALKISKQTDIYAYDVYVLECAIKQRAPLLTLDKKLKALCYATIMKLEKEILLIVFTLCKYNKCNILGQ
jgi:predicted nucleic acid-binding protein